MSDIEGWTCPRCGRQNKARWRFCPTCESMADGRSRADMVPRGEDDRRPSVLPGVFMLALLITGAALLLVFHGDIAEAVRAAGG